VTGDDSETREYQLPRGAHINVQEGERVRAGEPLMDAPIDPVFETQAIACWEPSANAAERPTCSSDAAQLARRVRRGVGLPDWWAVPEARSRRMRSSSTQAGS
jgi:hypothetical protein